MSERIEWAGHGWMSNEILKKEGNKSGKTPRGRSRQSRADRVVGEVNQCTQGVIIADSMEKGRWKNILEEVNVLQEL